jgi:hypothetical protein
MREATVCERGNGLPKKLGHSGELAVSSLATVKVLIMLAFGSSPAWVGLAKSAMEARLDEFKEAQSYAPKASQCFLGLKSLCGPTRLEGSQTCVTTWRSWGSPTM